MKKKVLLFLLAFVLMMPMISGMPYEVQAQETVEMEDIDYSYLNTADALVGYMTSQTRGVYLVDGTSTITKYSSSKIAAGGITNAAMDCKVSLNVIVEKYYSGSWVRVTSWNVTKASDTSVMSSKVLTIVTGYKYRVRCYHYAGTDSGSSYTNALKM